MPLFLLCQMYIEQLKLSNFRNIKEMEIHLTNGLNFFWGGNGAGKTSILESIFIAGRGKSFRQKEFLPIKNKNADYFVCHLNVYSKNKILHKIGIQSKGNSLLARINQENIYRRSQLAYSLPLQIITPNSHELLERGPNMRRRFMDMGLFHVEQSFHKTSSNYSKYLRQRNAAIRSKAEVLHHWNKGLVESAIQLNNFRCRYIDSITHEMNSLLGNLNATFSVQVKLEPGWDTEKDLNDLLNQRLASDKKSGFTSVGPHRADIKFLVKDYPAEKVLSRGQQKILVYALHLAQVKYQIAHLSESPVLLIDDLSAELDNEYKEAVLDVISSLDTQVLITSVDPIKNDLQHKEMFHVEHGCLV